MRQAIDFIENNSFPAEARLTFHYPQMMAMQVGGSAALQTGGRKFGVARL
jgi:hypothetical protein